MLYHEISILVKTAENAANLAELAPFTAAYPIPSKGCLYYLCEQNACKPPVNKISQLLHIILN